MSSQRGSTGPRSQTGDQNKDKLLNIQKKEQLKDLLITKFKNKYGKHSSEFQGYIENEVTKFLRNDRLTEQNLKLLDKRIERETQLREKKDQMLDDRMSAHSGTRKHDTLS